MTNLSLTQYTQAIPVTLIEITDENHDDIMALLLQLKQDRATLNGEAALDLALQHKDKSLQRIGAPYTHTDKKTYELFGPVDSTLWRINADDTVEVLQPAAYNSFMMVMTDEHGRKQILPGPTGRFAAMWVAPNPQPGEPAFEVVVRSSQDTISQLFSKQKYLIPNTGAADKIVEMMQKLFIKASSSCGTSCTDRSGCGGGCSNNDDDLRNRLGRDDQRNR